METLHDFVSIGEYGHSGYTWGHSGWTSGYETNLNQRIIHSTTDNGLVLLKCGIDNDNLVIESISGPMFNPDLDREGSSKCPSPSAILLSGLQGSFKSLAMMRAADDRFQGLDSIGSAIYIRRWMRIGAKLYVVRGGEASEINYDSAYELMPQLVHRDSHFWGKVTVWRFGSRYEVRWGGNGFSPKIFGYKHKASALKRAAKLSWEAYDAHDMKDQYNKEKSHPKLKRH